jgi:hypothetical protein
MMAADYRKLMAACAELVDSGAHREAVWAIERAVQRLDEHWYLDYDLVRLVAFGLRVSTVARTFGVTPYASIWLFIGLVDQVLFASTAGVGLLPPDVLEDLNAARKQSWNTLSRRPDLGRITL